MWHGWADQLIAAEGTIDYYVRIQQKMGGAETTSKFVASLHGPRCGPLWRWRRSGSLWAVGRAALLGGGR